MTESISKLFIRDLDRLKGEIEKYGNEEDLWKIDGDILNSAGNLCLHICGNLQHFVGAVMGNTGYERDRSYEFNARNIPREQLLEEVDKTKSVVIEVVEGLSEEQLAATFPINIWNYEMTTEYFLIHLYGHVSWHLGHINYHRRLLAS